MGCYRYVPSCFHIVILFAMVNQIPRLNHNYESLTLIDTGCHSICGVTRPSSSSKAIIIFLLKLTDHVVELWVLVVSCYG
jgi:hypothetical protein